MRKTHAFGVLGMAVLCGSALAGDPEAILIQVVAGSHARRNTPVSFELPDAFRAVKAVRLTDLDSNRQVDAQLEPGNPPRAVWILRGELPAAHSRRYRLAASDAGLAQGPAVTEEDDGTMLTIKIGSRPVLRYNEALVPSTIPGKPEYQRSGYIHPVFDPDGRIVTDDMAPDHAHQHGIMFPYEKVTFEGRHLNFWEPSNGTISHARVEATVSGPVFGGFDAALNHDENDLPGGLVPVVRETWRVRVYNMVDGFIFDLESVQRCATDKPVLIEKNSYGGLAIRCNRNWFDHREESEYLTSEGKTRENGNQTAPRWVDLYGLIDGKTSGIAIFDRPDNFRFPQPVRLHPEKPYFCFAPMAAGSFQIEPGHPMTSHYRFFVHVGKPDVSAIEAIWNDYAESPSVRLVNVK